LSDNRLGLSEFHTLGERWWTLKEEHPQSIEQRAKRPEMSNAFRENMRAHYTFGGPCTSISARVIFTRGRVRMRLGPKKPCSSWTSRIYRGVLSSIGGDSMVRMRSWLLKHPGKVRVDPLGAVMLLGTPCMRQIISLWE
jgi:hypothetical protein